MFASNPHRRFLSFPAGCAHTQESPPRWWVHLPGLPWDSGISSRIPLLLTRVCMRLMYKCSPLLSCPLRWTIEVRMTLFRDVKQYCQTSEECQLHGVQRAKAPMMPLPVIGEPFRRIAMDIVGPLPRMRRRHRFILVLSDYAT